MRADAAPGEASPSIERQLWSNQIWETVAFMAKAAFMLGLTPWMLRVWGAAGYGEFALASSTFVLLSILDLGIRGRTRITLCGLTSSLPSARALILGESVMAFGMVSLAAIVGVALLSRWHVPEALFRISPENHFLLLLTTAMAMLVLLTGLLLEPLIVVGQIGSTKLATAIGWLAAIPMVSLVLWKAGSVTGAVTVWLACLIAANAVVILFAGSPLHTTYHGWQRIGFAKVLAITRQGFWFNVANTTWLARTYGTTILISAVSGPAMAGIFFILLRLSEIISALGAISSDVLLGGLAQAKSVVERRQTFRSAYSWAILLCAHSAVVIGFLTPDFYRLWLRPTSPIPPIAGLVIAALGAGSALNRIATYAAMGIGLGRTAAKWGLVEAFAFISLFFVARTVTSSLLSQLGIASLSACALLFVAAQISRTFELPSSTVWLSPMSAVAPFVGASAVVLMLSSLSDRLFAKAAAVAICGVVALLNINQWKKGHDPSFSPRIDTAAPQMPC